MSFEIELNDKTYQGDLPLSFAQRDDVVSASRDNWRRSCCAALGLSVTQLRLKATYRSAGFNPLVFGGQVLDELMARGLSRVQIVSAGMTCWSQIADSLISEDEVKKEEDFLDPEKERSTL